MIVAELFAKLGLVPDQKSWDQGHELIEGLHHALEAYLGYEGLKKVGELVEGTVHAAVEAKHLGERLGITGEAVQELGYAADVTGASAEDMTSAMQRLAFGMENAGRTGTGPLINGLGRLHMHFADISKLPLDQRLEKIADGFAKAPPDVDKLGVAMEIFGRNAGPKLLPLLEKGSAGIEELRNEAQKLGVVIDEEGIEKAEEFEIAQKRLGATLKGLRNEAVIAIVPALQEMAEGLQAWIAANREAIVSTLTAVLKGVAVAFHLIGAAIEVVVDVVQVLSDHLDYLIPIISGVAAVLLPFLVEWTIGATEAAIATLLAAAPFILLGLAVAGVTLGIIKLIQHWKGIVSSVREVAGEVKDAFISAWDSVVEAAEDALEWVANLPVVKQLIDVYKFFTRDRSASNAAFDDALQQVQMQRAKDDPGGNFGIGGAFAPLDDLLQAGQLYSERGARTGGDVNINGDTHITVEGAGAVDPNVLAAKIKDAVDESNKDMLRQAHNNLSGGKR